MLIFQPGKDKGQDEKNVAEGTATLVPMAKVYLSSPDVFKPDEIARYNTRVVLLDGIDELAIVHVLLSGNPMSRRTTIHLTHSQSSWLFVAHNLAFKLIFDLVASPEPNSRVAGKLVHIATNSLAGTFKLDVAQTFSHLSSPWVSQSLWYSMVDIGNSALVDDETADLDPRAAIVVSDDE
ncbi:hypothetical protein C8J56DRAFT_1061830 [Mycena floridula]|nr:hypothetical protein C8J56DRAFT_1061830 [Mycena floridula]